jgi:Capsule assembly protein Wzi
MTKYLLLTLFILCFSNNFGFSQDTTISKSRTHYYAEVGTYISSNYKTPFLLRSNQFGIVPNKSPIATFRSGILYDYSKSHQKKYDWAFGIDVAVNVGTENKFYLPEAYIKVKLNKFEFYAGRRREIIGLVDTLLTSGSYSWSGNALPIPKIHLSIPNYLHILGKGFLSIKGSYSHGWFDNQGVIKDFYLHQKTFYARIGKPNWRVKMYGGFNHQVQWAGVPSIKMPSYVVNANGEYASGLNTYLYVIQGSDIAASVPVGGQGQFAGNDIGSRTGNHLGTFDIAIEVNSANSQFLIYRQSIFETAGLFYLNNIEDGLNGISWKNINKSKQNFIEAILVEYLYTKSQGGQLSSDAPLKVQRGRVNYFNHGQYLNGWAYEGAIIGTPFFTLDDNFIPLQNDAIKNNRVEVAYLGIRANLNKTKVEARIAYSNNIGTYNSVPINKNQFSALFKVIKPLRKNYQLNLMASFDDGTLYNNNLGIFVSIKKVGIL